MNNSRERNEMDWLVVKLARNVESVSYLHFHVCNEMFGGVSMTLKVCCITLQCK